MLCARSDICKNRSSRNLLASDCWNWKIGIAFFCYDLKLELCAFFSYFLCVVRFRKIVSWLRETREKLSCFLFWRSFFVNVQTRCHKSSTFLLYVHFRGNLFFSSFFIARCCGVGKKIISIFANRWPSNFWSYTSFGYFYISLFQVIN